MNAITRGGTPVGLVSNPDAVEAAAVLLLRRWQEGPDAQTPIWNDFVRTLGPESARHALDTFQTLFGLCARHVRKPILRHDVACNCLGANEACFAAFLSAAASGAREEAMLLAMLLVRPDVAPILAGLAAQAGLALRRMTAHQPPEPSGRLH